MKTTTFSIATSWDNQLVENLSVLNKQHEGQAKKVGEVFGSFQSSIVGCARPSYRLPQVSVEQAKNHIALLHDVGIKFNYTLNAPDFGGKENDADWSRKVERLLATLEEIGVDVLTISHPTLIKLIKEKFPRFSITVSLIAEVDTVEKAQRFESMGADTIVLNPHTVNRDLTTIEKICSSMDCKIELYCNIPCLHRCQKAPAHYAYLGHMSQTGNPDAEKRMDPYLAWCSCIYLTRPVELIKSPFIRPEDIQAYSELGVKIFKLSDRGESTSWLTHTIGAYMSEHYDGDLFNLIFRNGKKFRVGVAEIYPEIADQDLAISIDNNVLTEMRFLENIRSLPPAQLPEFYHAVMQRAVKVNGKGFGNTLKKFLREHGV